MHYLKRKKVQAWALYDWANSAFSLSVGTAFLPVLFSNYWNDGVASTVTTFRLGLANTLASLLVAISAPIIGAIADRAGLRSRFIVFFAGIGAGATFGLYFIGEGLWQSAIFLYVIATFGFASSNTIYDSQITQVAEPFEYDQVSAYGFALGYIGGALLFTVNVLMINMYEIFGFVNQTEATLFAFPLVSFWWIIFTLPLLYFVKDTSRGKKEKLISTVKGGCLSVYETIKKLKATPNILLFLIAYWLYIDGVYTIIKMAADYGLSQGLDVQNVIVALLITNYIGFPAALFFGYLAQKIGPKNGIIICISVYILVTIGAVFIDQTYEFYLLALMVGMVQGGIQSLSRSFYATLIPTHHASEYFGFFNLMGKFGDIIGPVLMGYISLLFGSQRIGILSILLLFITGLILFLKVSDHNINSE